MNLKQLLNKENPFILEIGCNDGSDTVGLLSLFSSPIIICFEPDPVATKAFMKRNLPVLLYSGVLSNTYGIIDFYPSNNTLSGSILKPKEHLEVYPQVAFGDCLKVQSMKLDTFMQGYFPEDAIIDFVWADVQGAEKELILGGIDTFTRKVKYFKTEFSKKELYEGCAKKEDILSLLPDYELMEIIWEWEADGDMLLRNKKLIEDKI